MINRKSKSVVTIELMMKLMVGAVVALGAIRYIA